MRIGIDISQMVHEGSGVAVYVERLVRELIRIDHANDYVLFGASLRKRAKFTTFVGSLDRKVQLVSVPIPPTFLHILWNVLHIIPIEWFIGAVDVFWSSDWTQPPLKNAKGLTTIHDLTPILFPRETDARIVLTHKKRLRWVQKECKTILCDSIATSHDVQQYLHCNDVRVIYPGI